MNEKVYEITPKPGAFVSIGDNGDIVFDGWNLECNGLPRPSRAEFALLIIDYLRGHTMKVKDGPITDAEAGRT